MIETYSNQSIVWKRRTGVNEYNEPTFTTSTIKGRFEYSRKMVRNAFGETVASEAVLFGASPVNVGDVIAYGGRDFPVIAVQDIIGIDGKPWFYEVSL